MRSRKDNSLDLVLSLLSEKGPMTLDDVVRSVGALGPRKERDLRRKIYAHLKADGPLIQNGFVSMDISGRYIISDKGLRMTRTGSDEKAGAGGGAVTEAGAAQAAAVAPPEPPETPPPQREPALRYAKLVPLKRALGHAAVVGRVLKLVLGYLRLGLAYAGKGCRHVLGLLRQGWLLLPVKVRRGLIGAALATLTAACILFYRETETSQIQSRYFAKIAQELTFSLGDGPSDRIVFPGHGPYDRTLGYSLLPGLLERITKKGYEIVQQARLSPRHYQLVQVGVYPLYHEKSAAGLTVLDATGKPLFSSAYPQLIYDSFEAIPKPIVNTLLFIENRDLLDEKVPYKNPTVEWSRLGRAVIDLVISKLLPGHDVPGGSTLATQIEKYRHSPEGRTANVAEKLRQMRSATLRAYLDGRNTLEARKRVVKDYINSVPLGAIPGAGEVRGIGHGLVAWHGANFTEVNQLLADVTTPEPDAEKLKAKALAYKEMLSLFLAQRRPAYYLQSNRNALKELVSKHLGLLQQAGILTPEFRKAVEQVDLTFRNNMIFFQPERLSFVERKGANAVRVHLMNVFGFDRLYTLDRLDLKVQSTIDYETQKEATALLQKLKDPDFAQANGLREPRLLASGDPKDVIYSFTLRERVGNMNVLRVQADNVDGPFNVSEGGKLELGSTAKFRTTTHYLEIVETLWREHARKTPEQLAKIPTHPADRLTQWALQYLSTATDKSLMTMLEAAMRREYSASPAEVFFTGSGAHRFNNFEAKDNTRVVDVYEALRKSINLPFIRMMREVVNYHVAQIPDSQAMLNDEGNPQRRKYLSRFANKEGREFLGHFYLRYRGMTGDDVFETLLKKVNPTARRLAAILSVVKPEATEADYFAFVKQRIPDAKLTDKGLTAIWQEMTGGRFTLHDKGYVATVHPLELWLVAYMYRQPNASFSQIMEASSEQRQEAYRWLFNSKQKVKQDRRIKIMLEQEAFQAIHQAWHRLGFPFGSLVPTYATAIGSSGDKPAALAELMGIVVSGGIRYTNARVTEMHFGEGTPFETKLRANFDPGTRVLSEEIATVLKGALRNVVEDGTAVRVKGVFKQADGTPFAVGGKTGTGDNRYSIFAPGGRVIESKVVSRTATFVFYIGDRFFGTLTAYVPSLNAENYHFTSALPAQVLKILAPKLEPLLQKPAA